MATISKFDDYAERPSSRAILVVEDDGLQRLTLVMELRQAGYSVREAADAQDAESLLKAGVPVDLIVTDLEMPGDRDGLNLAKAVREAAPHIRVIMVSGTEPQRDVVGAVDAFFGKPYDVRRLLDYIEALLTSPKGPQSDPA